MHFGRGMSRTYLTGRRVSKGTGLLSEKGEQVPCLWPTNVNLEYTVLDGEIMPPPGAGFRDIAGIMNSDTSKAAARILEIGAPTYAAFDILYLNGEDVRSLSTAERRSLLVHTICELRHPQIRAVAQLPASRASLDEILARGGEGVILKNLFATYGESGAWRKVKRSHTVDVVVTGFTEARFGRGGKYLGQIGAVRVSVRTSDGQLLEIGKVSGMTDEIRADMTSRPEAWLGGVIEVEAQEFGSERLRHPRFVRARPDADASSCTFDKMMRDLRCRDEEEKYQLTLL
jgi:ATP-dependent DNA ligase